MSGVSYTPDISGLQNQISSKANVNDVPLPATSMPPGVSDIGAVGTDTRYALANHTHASRARKEIKPISSSGLFTWVFPTSFSAGVVPICNAMAICVAGTTDIVNVQQEGDATNVQVTFRVIRFQQSVASLLGLTVLSISSGIPANTKLSLLALEP